MFLKSHQYFSLMLFKLYTILSRLSNYNKKFSSFLATYLALIYAPDMLRVEAQDCGRKVNW